MRLSFVPAVLVSIALAGCAVLPGSGPAPFSISPESIEKNQKQEYLVIRIDAEVANIAGRYKAKEFSRRFGISRSGRGQLIGVGDALSIKIWEAGDNGLFSNTQTKSTEVQSIVDERGLIFVPYAGRLRAAGRSVESLRLNIQNNLEDKAKQPQVQVIVKGNRANSSVIVGDVRKPGRYPLSLAGTRVLDLVAQAGGSSYPAYETVITLKRRGEIGTTVLENLFDFSENNVYLRSGDNILLAHNPRSYTAFGAVTNSQVFKFVSRTVTLAEALAGAGGLFDEKADPRAIFLFRFEEPEVARRLKPDLDLPAKLRVPIVYRLNLREPKGFFLARYFEMRNKDIIYVANSPAAELGKFLRIIQPLLNSAQSTNNLFSK